MAQLKLKGELEVGKKYKNRYGHTVCILRLNHRKESFVDDAGFQYTKKGNCPGFKMFDLIEEVKD